MKSRGFTLIEICLALGIVAFALVAILGLFAVGFDSSRRATENTLLASMTAQVISTLRQNPTAATIGITRDLYFDYAGVPAPAERAKDYFFDCTITTQSPAVSPGSSPIPDVTNTMVTAVLKFTWPVLQNGNQPPRTYLVQATLPAR